MMHAEVPQQKGTVMRLNLRNSKTKTDTVGGKKKSVRHSFASRQFFPFILNHSAIGNDICATGIFILKLYKKKKKGLSFKTNISYIGPSLNTQALYM